MARTFTGMENALLTVSLQGISLHAFVGAYEEEAVLGNDFEVDVDLHLDAPSDAPLPFADYTQIAGAVRTAFSQRERLIEDVLQKLRAALDADFPNSVRTVITVRKLHPAVPGQIAAAAVRLDYRPARQASRGH